jgi:rSAM/selenodomain-associated transferase 1
MDNPGICWEASFADGEDREAAGPTDVATVGVAIICKTPAAGRSKTRLSPPLLPEECAGISACFIADLATTIGGLDPQAACGYAVYTPPGSEPALRQLLPPGFGLVPQGQGDLGARLDQGIADLLAAGHRGAIMVNSDSPTLPPEILELAIAALDGTDRMVICPALDGGYTLIGLSAHHPRLFEDIVWSTETVFARTLDRAREIGLPVTVLPGWYDIDDARSYAMLEAELDGIPPGLGTPDMPPRDAPRTRAFVAARRARAAS